MILRPVHVLLIAVCLLAFPFRAPAPLVYHSGEGWVHEPAGGSSDIPREVVLQQQVVPYELETVYWNIDRTNSPLLKEPELSKQNVFRSVLRFGGKDTNNAIALVWDQARSKLYLDLNRNLDLTDDAAGVFSSSSKGRQQLFTNVTVPLLTAAGLNPVTLNLRLSADAAGRQIQMQLGSCSMWQAKVGPQGKEWQVAALDDTFNQEGAAAAKFLLLRPWAERTNRVYLRDLTSGIVRFPDQLFWLGQAFHLERRFETLGGTPVCRLALTPQQPPMSEVRLSGESLQYAVLHATNGYTAVLSEPPGMLRIPQGVYTVRAAWLKEGATKAFRLTDDSLLINATAPTNVVLGGPLTNSVRLTRQGRKLNMNYQLVGADGWYYHLAQEGRAKPPEFTIYQGGKKVHSGSFEFG